jgi:isopenicillin N synthase-like dioxygenase
MARSDDESDYVVRARTVALDQIPVVDFQAFLTKDAQGETAAAAAIAAACEEIGFFYLINHGVPAEDVSDLRRQSAAFFARPQAERALSAATPDWHRGWMDLSKVGLSSRSREIESYRIQVEHPRQVGADRRTQHLYAPNRWPGDMPDFRKAAERYFGHMTALSARLRQAFAMGLGLPRDRFDAYFEDPIYQLTLLHYGAIPPDEIDAVNTTPHTDEGPFTILWQDDVGGLEVKRRDGVWIAAPPIEGAFVINVGDMLMWWSNGRFLSNLHKVRNTSGRERFSIPFFANPDARVTVEPLPEFVTRDGRSYYPPADVGDCMMKYAPKEAQAS